jgi:hypothetical protein
MGGRMDGRVDRQTETDFMWSPLLCSTFITSPASQYKSLTIYHHFPHITQYPTLTPVVSKRTVRSNNKHAEFYPQSAFMNLVLFWQPLFPSTAFADFLTEIHRVLCQVRNGSGPHRQWRFHFCLPLYVRWPLTVKTLVRPETGPWRICG